MRPLYIGLGVGALVIGWWWLSSRSAAGGAVGGVAVPPGGSVDSNGRTLDANGNIIACSDGLPPSGGLLRCLRLHFSPAAPPAPPLTMPSLAEISAHPEARTGVHHF